jgi:hypothetical protein
MTFAVGAQAYFSGLLTEYAELQTAPVEVLSVAATWVKVKMLTSGQILKLNPRNLRQSLPLKQFSS